MKEFDKNCVICESRSRRLTKQELINLINKNFENSDSGDVAILTTVKSYNDSTMQSLTFVKTLIY